MYVICTRKLLVLLKLTLFLLSTDTCMSLNIHFERNTSLLNYLIGAGAIGS